MSKQRGRPKKNTEETPQSVCRFNDPDKQVLYIMELIDELGGEGVLHNKKRAVKNVIKKGIEWLDLYHR